MNVNLTLEEIFRAEVIFLKNNYYKNDFSNNFSYLVWYDKERGTVIVGKSKPKSQITAIEYLSSYSNIKEYIEKDLNVCREHIMFKEDGLHTLVMDFIRKHGGDKLLDIVVAGKRVNSGNIREELEREDLIASAFGRTITDENLKPIVDKDKILSEIKNKINEIVDKKIDQNYTDFEIKELQEKIEAKRLLNGYDLTIFAKFYLKAFGEKTRDKINQNELDDIIRKMLPKYFY